MLGKLNTKVTYTSLVIHTIDGYWRRFQINEYKIYYGSFPQTLLHITKFRVWDTLFGYFFFELCNSLTL